MRLEIDPQIEEFRGEEMARARVPTPIGAGLLAAAALIHFGRHDQQQHYLPRIRAGQDIWCQLFSEPGAGSDAEPKGDQPSCGKSYEPYQLHPRPEVTNGLGPQSSRQVSAHAVCS